MTTETSTTIDIFGLTDWNEMVKIASALATPSTPEPEPTPPLSWSPITPVGGTIFFIAAGFAGRVYEFFDANGNLIENVQVGDSPYSYRVAITEDAPTSDCYYVYHDELYEGTWSYWDDDVGYAIEFLGTSTSVGTGKTNTETAMTKDNGVYITADSNGYPTIWYQLQQARLAKVSGCDDWFIPSMDEAEELRLTVESGNIIGGTVAGSSYDTSVFKSNALWSSSEDNASSAWSWFNPAQRYLSASKPNQAYVFFIRAF